MTTLTQPPPPVTSAPVPRRRTSRMVIARRKEVAALVIPSLIPILLFSAAPLLNGVYLAFTSATLSRNSSNAFTGFGQFEKLLGDKLFLDSFRIGLIWAGADRDPAERPGGGDLSARVGSRDRELLRDRHLPGRVRHRSRRGGPPGRDGDHVIRRAGLAAGPDGGRRPSRRS
jgi:hypothetical protein